MMYDTSNREDSYLKIRQKLFSNTLKKAVTNGIRCRLEVCNFINILNESPPDAHSTSGCFAGLVAISEHSATSTASPGLISVCLYL